MLPDQFVLAADNPFAHFESWPQQIPPFDAIREEHFLPAFEVAMAQQRSEIEALKTQPGEPTFDNTVAALERSGQLLAAVAGVFFNLAASNSSEELQRIEELLAPLLSAHSDAVVLDRELYQRIAVLMDKAKTESLPEEDAALLRRYSRDFLRAGSGLTPEGQARLRELNTELSELTTSFGIAVLAETNDSAVLVTDESRLDGLPADAIAAAKLAAQDHGEADGYLITLGLPTIQPAMTSLRDRELRRQLFESATRRGTRGNDSDTRAMVTRIAALRAERAGLLGFADHASYAVADQTAGTVEAMDDMLTGLVPRAVANAAAEATELERMLHADGYEGPLQAWDWPYYASRSKQERFDLDLDALRPYFSLSRVIGQGVFAAATQLYGIEFVARPDLPVYHPDVQAFAVTEADGTYLGLLLADWYARDSKRGGAWMNDFVHQSHLLGHHPVVVINLNIPRPPHGEPALMTWEEVETAFHEFGHALHDLFSDVRYPRFAGTQVPRDFVEFPSQVNQMWAWSPELLAEYAVHHLTGQPLPPELVESLRAARSDGEGFATTEYLAATFLDQAWHRLPAGTVVAPEDVERFERDTLERYGLTAVPVMPRYSSAYFAHIFSGGYAAAYYSYMWSEVLDADTEEWFAERGGLNRSAGDIFRRELLAVGGSVEPMDAYRNFRGRDPRIEPLLRRRRLTEV